MGKCLIDVSVRLFLEAIGLEHADDISTLDVKLR